MTTYLVTVTVTYEGTFEATSAREAEELAEATNGAHPLDVTDVVFVAERVEQ